MSANTNCHIDIRKPVIFNKIFLDHKSIQKSTAVHINQMKPLSLLAETLWVKCTLERYLVALGFWVLILLSMASGVQTTNNQWFTGTGEVSYYQYISQKLLIVVHNLWNNGTMNCAFILLISQLQKIVTEFIEVVELLNRSKIAGGSNYMIDYLPWICQLLNHQLSCSSVDCDASLMLVNLSILNSQNKSIGCGWSIRHPAHINMSLIHQLGEDCNVYKELDCFTSMMYCSTTSLLDFRIHIFCRQYFHHPKYLQNLTLN